MGIIIRDPVPGDTEQIHKLITSYAEEGIIIQRSIQEIKQSIGSFLIALYNGQFAGVISFYDYGEKLKEIRSLVVKKELKNRGVGTALLDKMLRNIKSSYPEAKIFVLTYSPDFFKRLNFIPEPRDSFPEKIWKDCNRCKSKDTCGETAMILK